MRVIRRAAVLALSLTVGAAAQAPRKLGVPTAKLDQEFTGIDDIRELKDGRVIVLDAREFAVHIIDLKSGAGKKIGRRGEGPGEFQLPNDLLASRGDTTLINDPARFSKLLVVTPSGEIGGFVSTVDSTLGARNFVVGASDELGRLYENRYGGDSNAIVRWDRSAGRRDTIAMISMRIVTSIKPRTVGNAPAGSEMRARAAPRPFYGLSQWAVSADGRVAIVTPEPYRVSYFGVGPRVAGPVIPFTPIPVTESEKAEYRAERQRPVAMISRSNGVQSTSYVKPEYEEPDEWPLWLPAFSPLKSAVFASDGMLWLRRYTKAGAAPLYDVIDREGKVAFQLELPPKTKVVGFGAGSVYLARVDDDDLHYLEKYALPASRPIRP
jgi:hypothetical protein